MRPICCQIAVHSFHKNDLRNCNLLWLTAQRIYDQHLCTATQYWLYCLYCVIDFGKFTQVCTHMAFLNLFLRLPIVLSISPLKLLEWFWCGIHSNRIGIMRNDLICFIEKDLFYFYNERKTDGIWNFIFSGGQSSIAAIGLGGLCLVKIFV